MRFILNSAQKRTSNHTIQQQPQSADRAQHSNIFESALLATAEPGSGVGVAGRAAGSSGGAGGGMSGSWSSVDALHVKRRAAPVVEASSCMYKIREGANRSRETNF